MGIAAVGYRFGAFMNAGSTLLLYYIKIVEFSYVTTNENAKFGGRPPISVNQIWRA